MFSDGEVETQPYPPTTPAPNENTTKYRRAGDTHAYATQTDLGVPHFLLQFLVLGRGGIVLATSCSPQGLPKETTTPTTTTGENMSSTTSSI